MLTINGIKYLKKGEVSSDKTITHYYYTDTINNTYNIIYKGKNAKLYTETKVYKDVTTNQIIKKDFFNYTIDYGSGKYGGVCYSKSDEDKILDMVDTSNKDTSNSDGSNDDNPNTNDESENDSSGTNNKNTSNTGDNANDSDGDGKGSKDSSNKGIFEDSMGNKDKDNPRSSLPLGADIDNPNVIGISVPDVTSPNIKENQWYNKGAVYPIIRINDHYFESTEIQHFSMETGYYKNYNEYEIYQMPLTGVLPTMRLIVTTSDPGLLKKDFVKQGDRCSVFFQSGHAMIKSMRCDFRITNVVSDQMDQTQYQKYQTQIITGELYVPDLRNEESRYNFNGSSRDAMMDLAKRLRLSFFFCDPDDTNDVMVWCNCKSPEMFLHDLTTHAWKDSNSFFESWIDPRYGLAFMNINRLLGESGYDESIDMTFWTNTFINNRAIDGKAANKTEEEQKVKPHIQTKIFTNITDDNEAATVYHVNNWRLLNNAQEIQDFVGLNCKMQYSSVNTGLIAPNNPNYSVEFSLCLNRTKFDPTRADNDFFVLLGPGRNMTYASGDSAMATSETQSSNKNEPEKITNQQSDGDAAYLEGTGNNMMSSGNTHRFYEVAYEHNMRNLLQLQKQYLLVELNGANLSIVRGEKMPIVLMDLNRAEQAIRTGQARTKIEECMYEAESGWYIIDGIEWVFDIDNDQGQGTNWRTNVKLVRREWPVPSKIKDKSGKTIDKKTANTIVLVDIGNGKLARMAYYDALKRYGEEHIKGATTSEDVVVSAQKKQNISSTTDEQQQEQEEAGTIYNAHGKETVDAVNFNLDMIDQYVKKSDYVAGSTIPLTGLKSFMKDIYKTILSESDNKCKLVSGRRWAVDEYGNKVDGNAFIKKYDYYKCMNAIGEVMYFKKNNSRHLYGEAIDIINNGMDFTELMTNIIMKSPTILKLFYDYGVSAYIEQARDDTGATTKHYHIGTDTIKQREFWESVKAILGSDRIPGTLITFTNYMTKNTNQQVEFSNSNDIDENTLDTNSNNDK